MNAGIRRFRLLFLPALGILLADQLSKLWVRNALELGESVPREGFIRLTYLTNAGGAFGLLINPRFLLVLTAAVGILIVLIYLRYLPSGRALQVGLGLVLGGALGNLIDRLRFGAVTDFIDVRLFGDFHWPAFNLADSAITVGVFILAYFLVLGAVKAERGEMPQLIAIDGPGGVGKNTVGSLVAKRLGYRFIDTGAMYRALTWLALSRGVSLEDEEALTELARSAKFELENDKLLLNGREVGPEIREEEVEKGVSLVARVAGVRRELVARQRELAKGGRVVMAGRDIGTVVLPQADRKIFLSASPEERARRRHRELLVQGKQVSFEETLAQLKTRDEIDSQRAASPLKPAPDARIINTDGLGVRQVVAEVMKLVQGA